MKKQKKPSSQVYYYYDREGDVFYLSQGKPSPRDRSIETDDDVIMRTDPNTGAVRGFSIINFSKRLPKQRAEFVRLPVEARFSRLVHRPA